MQILNRLAAVVVVIAAGVTAGACGGAGEENAVSAPASGKRSMHAGAEEIASIPVGAEPGELAVGFGSVWAVSLGRHVARIDPSTNAVTARIKVANGGFLGVGAGSVWVPDYWGDKVRRIDPVRNKVVATIAVGDAPAGVAFTRSAVWVANHHGGSVSRIDPSTNNVVATVRVGPSGRSGPQALATGAGAVWVGVPNLASVVRIDPTTNEVVAKIPMPDGAEPCGGLAADERGVWVSGGGCAARVARIDPATNKVVDVIFEAGPVEYGVDVGDPILTGGSLWLTKSSPASAVLYEIDEGTGKTISKTRLRRGAGDIFSGTFGFGSLWLVDGERARVIRMEPR